MRWLIRTLHRKGRDQVTVEEDVHFGEVLGIGRGADQAVYLPDLRAALEHARVTRSGSRYRVESRILAGVRVNGASVQTAMVDAGALIEIGDTEITLVDPPEGYDGAAEIRPVEREAAEAEAATATGATRLADTWLGRRASSWVLFLGVALLGFGLPLLGHFWPAADRVLASSPLPSRGAWEAGDLASAHHFFGGECQQCHDRPFQPVRDDQCLACHGALAAHANPVRFDLPELGAARCAHCHRDHNGPDGLVRQDQALCSDCHVGLAERSGGASSLPDIGDFAAEHPEFKVTLPDWNAAGGYEPRRVSLDLPGLSERSGLKFPHDLHLAAEGIKGPEGERVLDCGSCHRMEPGGGLMEPVDFETMCQDCHTLGFDVTEPERQVPHGKVDEILFMLDEFYARRALDGQIRDPTAPESLRTRRRPGQPVTREIRQEAFAWARDKARQVGETLFTGRACAVCHEVRPGAGEEPPWVVAPVRVAGAWFPKARFPHTRHATMACADCHQAEQSGTSADLLLPGIANCRTCHGGGDGGDNLLSSSCTACHGYHESPLLLMREL